MTDHIDALTLPSQQRRARAAMIAAPINPTGELVYALSVENRTEGNGHTITTPYVADELIEIAEYILHGIDNDEPGESECDDGPESVAERTVAERTVSEFTKAFDKLLPYAV